MGRLKNLLTEGNADMFIVFVCEMRLLEVKRKIDRDMRLT